MLTKIEVTKTYWIGISETQRIELRKAIMTVVESDNSNLCEMTKEEKEAFSELRQALLNV